jgi:uncharacterized protein
MKYRERAITPRLLGLTQRFAVVVLSGARQVGKSTLVEHVLPDWRRVVLDPVVDVGNARSDPDLFLRNFPAPLIIDEIQYAPELIASIKRAVDRSRVPGQYVLTGSQQWQVLKSASESLAGRAVFLDLESFSLGELGEHPFDTCLLERYLTDPGNMQRTPRVESAQRPLSEQLWRGFLPDAQVLDLEYLPDFLRAYFRSYVERDIRHMADVSDWQQFGRFVRLAAALTAQEINRSHLGREIGITPQTAQRWLAMLVATFQWVEVPAFHANSIKRISSKSKGYLADTGLACSLQSISSPDALAGHPVFGALFETAVVNELRKQAATVASPPVMYHWRSHGGAEVDLVLERNGTYYPIEIKLRSRPTRADTRGIRAFRESYPALDIAPGLVLYPGEEALLLNDEDVAVPWDW